MYAEFSVGKSEGKGTSGRNRAHKIGGARGTRMGEEKCMQNFR
jgi:hypothetical protein